MQDWQKESGGLPDDRIGDVGVLVNQDVAEVDVLAKTIEPFNFYWRDSFSLTKRLTNDLEISPPRDD